jgi:hypothetical protein
MLSSGKLTPSTIPHLHLNGAQSLQPFTAYGLPALCLRLTPTVTGTRSRLDNRYGGSPLPVLYFQLLANKCLVAHQLRMQINTPCTRQRRTGRPRTIARTTRPCRVGTTRRSVVGAPIPKRKKPRKYTRLSGRLHINSQILVAGA